MPSDIDRFIELGLNRFGAGDLDGALLMWEEALAIDPDNAQANSYVDYVRLNYELLSSGEPEVATDDSYGIDDEPEYLIEILPGQLEAVDPAPLHMDPLDAGWFMEEETHDAGRPHADDPEAGHKTFELEADEPLELEIEAQEPLVLEAEEPPAPDFEDATREYYGVKVPQPAQRPTEFSGSEPPTTEFQHEETTGGFRAEPTPVGFSTQETEVRKRDLGFVQPTIGRQPTADRNPFATIELADDVPDGILATPLLSGKSTKDMPEKARPPAPRDSESHSQAEVMIAHAPTQDFGEPLMIDVAAPTRELGLRPTTNRGIGLEDEDLPTKQSDARAIRAAAARRDGDARPASEGTKKEIVLPFDPIDARSAQILDDVDEGAPAGEPREEQTRRRITMLLQRAVEYNASGEVDKAVTAVDLALSEDPNSALAQKLVTRNRDAILSVYQGFIGDLERMPQLAKPLHELSSAPISPRAAFLLSRIDGTLTVDELLDVSGMPKLEAYRHMCQLFLRGILR